MNAARSAARILSLATVALALASNAAIAAHGPHDDDIKSPFDRLGGIGGTNTHRAPPLILGSAGTNLPSPVDALGGIGGKDTHRAPAAGAA